ncbi:hypothetical protein [Pseudaeromonas paramecii]|uniref:Uncharacterized protein n=1 Tax=Pseudaeromonas paramecii TaxID=2138166 RepID=A0ABP8QJK6_9GAMM
MRPVLLLTLLLTACAATPPQVNDATITPVYRTKADGLFLAINKQKSRQDGEAGELRLAALYENSDDPTLRHQARDILLPLAERGFVLAQKRLAYGESSGRYGPPDDAAATRYLARLQAEQKPDHTLTLSLQRDKQLMSTHQAQLTSWYAKHLTTCPNRATGWPAALGSDQDYLAVRALVDCLLAYGASDQPSARLQALSDFEAIRCAAEPEHPCRAQGFALLASGQLPTEPEPAALASLVEALSLLRAVETQRLHLGPQSGERPVLSESVWWEIQYAEDQAKDGQRAAAYERLAQYRQDNRLTAKEQAFVDLTLARLELQAGQQAQAQTRLLPLRHSPQLPSQLQQSVQNTLIRLSVARQDLALTIQLQLESFSPLPERDRLLPASLFSAMTP